MALWCSGSRLLLRLFVSRVGNTSIELSTDMHAVLGEGGEGSEGEGSALGPIVAQSVCVLVFIHDGVPSKVRPGRAGVRQAGAPVVER